MSLGPYHVYLPWVAIRSSLVRIPSAKSFYRVRARARTPLKNLPTAPYSILDLRTAIGVVDLLAGVGDIRPYRK